MISMNSKELGMRIKHLRIRFEIPQQDLAKKLQISPQMLSQIEAGKKFPTLAVALAIAKEFDTTVDELAGDLI